MPDYTSELEFAIATAIEAGEGIRRLYDANSARTYMKPDESPVTDADLASDRIIRSRIVATYPNDAILTEEGVDDEVRLSAERVWIVDPIDGTIQFVERTGQFDVLMALVVDRPAGGQRDVATADRSLRRGRGWAGAIFGFAGSSERTEARLAPPGDQSARGNHDLARRARVRAVP